MTIPTTYHRPQGATRGGQVFTSFDDRTVIVTGGSKGIGKGIARVFSRAGANVLLAARDEAALRAAADELAAGAPVRIETVAADVSRVEDCRRLAETAVDRFGGIDVLCANAGIFPDKPLAELTEGDVDAVLGCNLKGTMFSVQACDASPSTPSFRATSRRRGSTRWARTTFAAWRP
jgi:3-oxoacyl-[acyl-carrier protein] reductase